MADLIEDDAPVEKDDPLHLRREQPDYVENRSGTNSGKEGGGDLDAPQVGTDAEPGETSVHKTIVAPDPAKVAEAEARGGDPFKSDRPD